MKTTAYNVIVLIAVEAWQRIEHWIRLADDFEVSGLGLVAVHDGQLVVTDVYLPAQTNGSANTELDPDSIAKLMLGLEQDGLDSGRLKFWWHYHPGHIGLSWSGTDNSCVEGLSNGGLFVSSVFGPGMAVRTRVDLFSPVRVVIDEVQTLVQHPDLGLADECERLYAERAKKAVPRRVMPHIFGPGKSIFQPSRPDLGEWFYRHGGGDFPATVDEIDEGPDPDEGFPRFDRHAALAAAAEMDAAEALAEFYEEPVPGEEDGR